MFGEAYIFLLGGAAVGSSKDGKQRSKVCDKIRHKTDTYEMAYEALRRHEIEHTVRFVARTCGKNFGKTGIHTDIKDFTEIRVSRVNVLCKTQIEDRSAEFYQGV